MNAKTFATQSFHDLDLPDPPTRRCDYCGRLALLTAAALCLECTAAWAMQHHTAHDLRDQWHAAGGHCRCASCAAPRPAVTSCLRGLDDDTCATRCCACCDDGDRLEGDELCAACATDRETDRRADEDLDRPHRLIDTLTPTDVSYDQWKARER